MLQLRVNFVPHRALRYLALALLAAMFIATPRVAAQESPLISGGMGFFTNTNGGNTSYSPTLAPVLVAPIGQNFLVESRANLVETWVPTPNGYDTVHFVGLTYAQLDYLVNPHLTLVGGYFLTPFGSVNERLTPIWINNFVETPLTSPVGIGTGSSSGIQARGSAVSTPNFSIDYAAYYAFNSTNEQFQSQRAAGGRVSVYFPKQGLEVGTSYSRSLIGVHTNASEVHLWWEPIGTFFRVRSEYDHDAHATGYWIETDYRLSHFGGPDSLIGRIEPVFRWQQIFRNSPDPTDGLPGTGLKRVEFGLDYRLPHEVRVLTSYTREITPFGDRNIWQTGLVYRFLFPAWKGNL